ncbi:hypothetical protein L226DRAFT_32780 [Lentinus tigrinus ALCF2SS1-7]|uniref:uncharacterized protein n=1 Tax=Lentinus tigrinus ALCF2SS1-7 TaxID=1328758 RepID=UPI001165E933|nr:hypothetical protein L226DRAFT_32780 [Lentinus tigrinus ALCF2SS1-7]
MISRLKHESHLARYLALYSHHTSNSPHIPIPTLSRHHHIHSACCVIATYIVFLAALVALELEHTSSWILSAPLDIFLAVCCMPLVLATEALVPSDGVPLFNQS